MDPTTTLSDAPLPGPEIPGGPGAPPEMPSAGPPSGPAGRSKAWVIAAVGAVVCLGVAVLVVALWPSHHKKVTRLVLPPAGAVVSAGGRQLVSLLKTGEGATFHAIYRVVGPAANGTQALEIWQAPPRVREDTSLSLSGHTAKTESFTEGSVTHLCIQRDGGPWGCTRSAVDPNNVVSSLTGQVAGQPVAVSDTTIGNRKVRCFAIGSSAGGLQLCATAAGIPVLIASANVRYELVTLDSSVNSSSFSPPAADK
jgi:hypothetical protein